MTDSVITTGDALKLFVERIECLDEKISSLTSYRKDVFADAKQAGLDPAVIRKLIANRKKNQDDLDTFNYALNMYEEALASNNGPA